MCGANQQQKDIEAQQQQFYTTMNQNYQTMFGQQQQVLNALTSTFQPIVQAGPYQAGYSPAEETALNTGASENIAQNYAAAQKATAQQLAARGGDTVLPSSTAAQILAQGTNAAAQARASALNANTINNYNLGYSNWTNAANVLSSVAGLQNPNAYASSATSAGSAASTSAAAIAAAANSPWNAAIGAVGALGGAALGNIGGIASAFGKGAQTVLSSPQLSGVSSWMNMAPPSIYSGPGMGSGTLPNLSGLSSPYPTAAPMY